MLVLLAVLAGRFYWQQRRNEPSVAARLATYGSDSAPGTVVDLALLVPATWDTVHVFGPYTSSADVDAQLGFPWGGGAAARIASSDGAQLLVFTLGKQVVAHHDIARVLIAPARPIPRAKARFVAGAGGLTWQGD